MFSVMLNVAMREGGNNMHKEQCIGPGHWEVDGGWGGGGGESLVVSSVFQWRRLATDPLLQAVGEGRREKGREGRGGMDPSLNEWRHPVGTNSLCVCSFFFFLEGEKGGLEGSGLDLGQSDLSFFFSFINGGRRGRSPVCRAQFKSVVVLLQSPFQHAADAPHPHPPPLPPT